MSSAAPVSESERGTLIEQIRDEFTFSHDGEGPQREREEADLRFQVPEEQWDEDSRKSRQGSNAGGIVVLPRPMVSISKVDQPHRLIMNQAHQARLGINIHPVSETANDETANVLQDLIRRIERDSDANNTRLWALSRASLAGRGVYRIVVRPDEDGFQYGDLEIGIERFLHQGCVYLDPSAQMPDYSDGDFAYITTWLRVEKAKRMFKASRVAKAGSEGIAWSNLKDSGGPLWTRETGSGVKSIQVAERFWKHYHEEKLLLVETPSGAMKAVRDGIDKMPRGKVVDERVRSRVEVWKYVTDGFEILEKPTKWLGKYIPIVPVLGRELHPYDEQRRIIGIIRNARDAQRLFNSTASVLMERLFAEPRSPWTGPEGFDEGREAQWARANIDNVPVLKYKPTLIPGTQTAAHPPTRTQLDSQGIQMALMAMQQAAVLCQDATAFFDPSLGKGAGGGQQESGRKVLALQGQGDAANGDWLQQLAVAMRYEAIQLIDLIAPADKDRTGVYDAPGRIASVVGGEPEKSRQVMLNQHHVIDKATGKPKAVNPRTKGAKFFDLKSGARYGVSIEIGSSYKTRLQEGDEALSRIIEADPTLMAVIGDLLFAFKDIPGSKKIAERLEALVRGQHPEFFQDDEESPESAAMKVKALEKNAAALSQQLQQAVQYIQTDQAKHDAAAKVKEMEFAFKVKLQEMQDATTITVEQIKLQAQGLKLVTTARNEALATGQEQVHESVESEKDRQHESQEHNKEMAHEVGMAAAGGNTIKRTTDRGQESGQEQSQESGQDGSQSQENSNESGPPPAAGGGE